MPGEALKDIKKECYLMLQKTREMLEFTEEAFAKNKVGPLDQAEELAREIHGKEDALTEKLAKLAQTAPEARSIVSVPAHIEKISTVIKRIQESARTRIKEGMLFSDKAIQETGVMFSDTKDLLKKAGEAMIAGGKKQADDIISAGDAIERLVNVNTTAHENRIISGESTPKSSTVYLCILYAFEDIAGHIKDIAQRVRG